MEKYANRVRKDLIKILNVRDIEIEELQQQIKEQKGKVLIRRDHAQDMLGIMKLLQEKYINKGKVQITSIGNVNECIIIAVEQAIKI